MIAAMISAAFACGLQNALATSYSGAVLRTTHMTGICTDIGLILGQACRRDVKAELWKLTVFVPLLLSYFCGGLLGLGIYNFIHEYALLFPCVLTGSVAVFYLTWSVVKEARLALKAAQFKGHVVPTLAPEEFELKTVQVDT